MHFPYYVARRYLLGKKSRNAINYITAISIAVTALVTMALIVILSIFNGLSSLISSLYGSFDPDLKISTNTGKYFDPTSMLELLSKYDDLIHYTEVIEEDVLLKYNKKQFIGVIKGVGTSFKDISNIDSLITDGKFDIRNETFANVAVGQGVAYYLSIGLNFTSPIHIYAPNPEAKASTAPDKAFKHKRFFPTATFSVQQDIDSKYIIADKQLVAELIGVKNKVTSIEIGYKNNADPKQIETLQKTIQSELSENLIIQNQEEQHQFLYKIMKSEKWAIFLIISFILIIASFNIVGSLSMLIIDKKKDINILKSLGANLKLIKKIFIFEGWLITGSGIGLGLLIGITLCYIQEVFGVLKLQGAGNFIVTAYPVQMQLNDIIIVTLTVSAIGFTAAFYPVSRISQKFIN